MGVLATGSQLSVARSLGGRKGNGQGNASRCFWGQQRNAVTVRSLVDGSGLPGAACRDVSHGIVTDFPAKGAVRRGSRGLGLCALDLCPSLTSLSLQIYAYIYLLLRCIDFPAFVVT